MRLITKTLLTVALGVAPVSAFAAEANVSMVTVTPVDPTPGAITSLNVTFTTTNDLPDTAEIILTMFDDTGALNSDFDFNGATIDYGDLTGISSDGDVLSDQTFYGSAPLDGFSLRLDSTLPAGVYTVAIDNVVNPSTAADYYLGGSTNSGADLLSREGYTLSDLFSIQEPVTTMSAQTVVAGLKVKDVTKREALLKWDAYSSTEDSVVYTVQVFKKNGDKIKTFNNVTTAKKQITKSMDLLKAGKTYKFRVKACLADDTENCTAFSAYKSFTMKAAE